MSVSAEGVPSAGRRTFVLIPGAGGSAWYWHRLVPLLQAAGHAAIAVDLPGDDPAAALPQYADLVASAIGGRDNVVLVAMSLGGFTAPMVAAKAPVRSLVFVNAMIPDPGETAGAWWANTGWSDARAAAAKRGGYATDFDLEVYFLHDVPPEVAAAGEPYQRPEAEVAATSSPWRARPSWRATCSPSRHWYGRAAGGGGGAAVRPARRRRPGRPPRRPSWASRCSRRSGTHRCGNSASWLARHPARVC